MKNTFRLSLLSALAILLTSPGLNAQHYVVTADDQNGPASTTLFKLKAPTLRKVRSLSTGGDGAGEAGVTFDASQPLAVTQQTSGVCIFVADAGSSDIAAFRGATIADAEKIGNYSDSGLVANGLGMTLAATPNGEVLYAAYPQSVSLAVWQIEPGCALSLANTLTPRSVIVDMKVAPNGKTLITTFGQGVACPSGRGNCQLDSFAISGADLTEKGPFTTMGTFAAGIDITKDSKYAIIGLAVMDTAVDIFPINSNSSLGKASDFYFPNAGSDSNNIWLSPNEEFLFVANNASLAVTTLNYTESPPKLTFACVTGLHNPGLGNGAFNSGLATDSISGAGSYLYVAETGSLESAVGVLAINSTTGCTTEVSGSPFLTGQGYGLGSLSAYPARPF
jgi:hypothetical protein